MSIVLWENPNAFESLLKCRNSELTKILQIHSIEQGVQWDYHLLKALYCTSFNADWDSNGNFLAVFTMLTPLCFQSPKIHKLFFSFTWLLFIFPSVIVCIPRGFGLLKLIIRSINFTLTVWFSVHISSLSNSKPFEFCFVHIVCSFQICGISKFDVHAFYHFVFVLNILCTVIYTKDAWISDV